MRYKPIEDALDQKFALFNEIMVSVYLYLIICPTEFNGGNPLMDELGYTLMFVVAFTVTVNFIKAVKFIIDDFRKL